MGKRLFDKGMEAFKEAQVYADDSIRAVCTKWDADELEKRASPALKGTASKEQMRRLMEQCKAKLGALKTIGEHTQPQFHAGATTGSGAFQTVGMVVSATFEKGTADIRITVVKSGDSWQINEFHVNWPL